MKGRILSGIQPTGNLHLGNYLGAIRNWVRLQGDYQCLYMLADLHAITVPQDPKELTKNTREMAAALIACGIDPKKSIIFPQSHVTMHAELAWILSCYTPLGWLNRMTQFKEKAKIENDNHLDKIMNDCLRLIEKNERDVEDLITAYNENKIGALGYLGYENSLRENTKNLHEVYGRVMTLKTKADEKKNQLFNEANLGLFGYPVLMAADILGYHATHVPVGEDQKQHLELSRDIAGAFNRACKEEFFPLPEPLILGEATRVMSLNDGTRKMSKSEESDYSRINLMDDADTIAKKFKKAKSDSFPEITYEPGTRPDIANLLVIYAALSDVSVKQAAEQFAGKRSSDLKNGLADLAVAKLSPITAKMRELMNDLELLDSILLDGAQKARDLAKPVLAGTMERVGFLQL